MERVTTTLTKTTGPALNVEIPTREEGLMAESSTPAAIINEKRILLFSIFVAGLCSLIYELLIGTTSTYFLGDSIKYFSLTVGIYMAAMGLGSYLSRHINAQLLEAFILVEIVLAFIGGISVPFLYWLFSIDTGFIVGMIACIFSIGLLTGLEIPLLSRILSNQYSLRENLSNVLSLDYIGALIATLCFPFLILPFIGLFKTSLVFGLVNLGIGVLNIVFLAHHLEKRRKALLQLGLILSGLLIMLMLVFSNFLLHHWEQGLYSDRIVSVVQSPYQRIVLTKHKEDLRLYLDGNLQFSSIDEYRYHEVLVHVPIAVSDAEVKNVLILGGGDGLAARELLKYPQIASIDIVDLDKEVSKLCLNNQRIRDLNQGSLENPRVRLIHTDAFNYIRNNQKQYDLIISDLPDPNNNAISRLYSKEFYKWMSQALSTNGIFITQASSPIFSKKAFWCINQTLSAAAIDHVIPMHVYVPSFGDWGFVMASHERLNLAEPKKLPATKFLDAQTFPTLFHFPNDQIASLVETSTLDRPIINKYYEEGWIYWK